jgi:hypothetical protein
MTYDMRKSNSLYHLIRERAGSRMLREAEEMETYNNANALFKEAKEKCVEEAFTQIKHFKERYPILETEIPMGFISLREIAQIDLIELHELPRIYVDMLRSLTWNDEIAGSILNRMIEDWWGALSDVENGDAFDHAYAEWFNERASHDLDDAVEGLDCARGGAPGPLRLAPLPPSPPSSPIPSPPRVHRMPLM